MTTILIIDDEQMICRALKRFLRSDYTVFTAHSAAEADTILSDTVPDVILCDVVMPYEDGLSFYQRQLPTIQDRFVFMTGYVPVHFQTRALVDSPVLAKPFRFEQLTRVLQEQIDRVRCDSTSEVA
ncbi:MAG: response regulator [Myxococcota bacterium]